MAFGVYGGEDQGGHRSSKEVREKGKESTRCAHDCCGATVQIIYFIEKLLLLVFFCVKPLLLQRLLGDEYLREDI